MFFNNAANPEKQVINQWIAMTFIAVICFWVVLYYFVNRTEAFGNDYLELKSSYSLSENR